MSTGPDDAFGGTVKTISIDCAGVTDIAEFWQRYLDAVQPGDADLFGRNLDAFWDAIEGGGPGWPGPVRLVFTNTGQMKSLKTVDGGSFLEKLRRIAGEATRIDIELT
ncbi:barstar family protein [Rhizobium sp. RCAM05350]|nr:barstar family protein [Rhizobium sp. RCAM05350]